MEKQFVEFRDLGRMDYQSAWNYQDVLMKENLAVKAGGNQELTTKHYLLFVEHPPV